MVLASVGAYIGLAVVAITGTAAVFVLMIYYIVSESKARKIW